jgi:hypothetical protein
VHDTTHSKRSELSKQDAAAWMMFKVEQLSKSIKLDSPRYLNVVRKLSTEGKKEKVSDVRKSR